MDNREPVATIQIGRDYIPVLKALAKADGRSMRKYVEVFIVEKAKIAGLLKKKGE